MNQNTTNQLLALCLAIITLVTACTKNTGSDDDNAAANKKLVLTNYSMLNPTWSAGLDTIRNSYFTYDANKRITKVVSKYFDSPGVIRYTETHNRFYQGSDTLPFKVESLTSSAINGNSKYIHLLYYDAQGVIIKDSIEHIPSGSTMSYFFTLHFTKSANNIITLTKSNSSALGYTVVDSIFTAEKIVNGNLLYKADTMTHISPLPSVQTEQYEATYDNKYNPFRSILLAYPFCSYGMTSRTSAGAFNGSVNNPVYIRLQLPSGSVSTGTISYFYNSAGYPDSSKSYLPTGTYVGKTTFSYSSF